MPPPAAATFARLNMVLRHVSMRGAQHQQQQMYLNMKQNAIVEMANNKNRKKTTPLSEYFTN